MSDKTFNARFSIVIDKAQIQHLPRDKNFVQIHMDMPAQSHELLGEMITSAIERIGQFRDPTEIALLITFSEDKL